MSDPLLLSIESLSDPSLLASPAGEVIFFNAALSQKLDREPKTLSDLLPAELVNQILSTPHFSAGSCDLKLLNKEVLAHSFVAIELGSGEPAERKYLFIFKSAWLDSSRERFNRLQLLAEAAHDLKNPLGAIFGYADALLETKIGSGLSAEQQNLITRIKNTSSRGVNLVRNYQKLAEISERSNLGIKAIVDLNSIVYSVVAIESRKGAEFPSIELALSTEPIRLSGASSDFERIVSNIIANALQHAPAGSKVRVETEFSNGRAIFRATNGGPPIPAQELSEILERGVRGSSSRDPRGSGLGLFIVNQLVSDLGGHLNITSNAESGTIVEIAFRG